MFRKKEEKKNRSVTQRRDLGKVFSKGDLFLMGSFNNGLFALISSPSLTLNIVNV